MSEETTKRAIKVKETIKELITEYNNIPISCSKCGDKIRTDSDNKIYCPNGEADCPLI